MEANLAVRPATDMQTTWSADNRDATSAAQRALADRPAYMVTVAASARLATARCWARTRALSFTTQTAPSVSEFEVRLLSDHAQPQVNRRKPGSAIAYDVADGAVLGLTPLIDAPIDTLDDASAETGIRIAFSAPMDMADVEARFNIQPRVRGSFRWRANEVLFTPRGRLAGGHALCGHPGRCPRRGPATGWAGTSAFSFTTRADAELVRFTPERHATNVKTKQLVLRFSEPMNKGFDGRRHQGGGPEHRAPHASGRVDWQHGRDQLRYVFKAPLPRGGLIEVSLGRHREGQGRQRGQRQLDVPHPAGLVRGDGAGDRRRHPCTPGRTGPGRAGRHEQAFALWQINQARANHGIASVASGRGPLGGGLSARVGHAEQRLLQSHRSQWFDHRRPAAGWRA